MKIINPELIQEIPAAPESSPTSSHPDDHLPEETDQKFSEEEDVILITPQGHKS